MQNENWQFNYFSINLTTEMENITGFKLLC